MLHHAHTPVVVVHPLVQLSEVERLLTVGSSVYSLDSNGDTPLDLASRAGYLVS